MNSELTLPERTRPGLTAWIAGAALIMAYAATNPDYVYPKYAAGLVFQSAVLLLLVPWAWREAKGGTGRLDRGAAWLMTYGSLAGLSVLRAPSRHLALIGALPILFHVAWAVGLGRMLRRRASVQLVLRAMFFAGTLAALLGVYYVFLYKGVNPAWTRWMEDGFQKGVEAFRRRHGVSLRLIERVHGHRNFLACALIMPVLIGVADLLGPWLCREKRDPLLGLPTWVVASCAALMLVVLVLCKSIGGMLGLAAGLAVLAAIRMPARLRRILLIVIVVAYVLGIAIVMQPAVVTWLLEHHGSQATRVFLWQGTVRMIAERPVRGWGAGMFAARFAPFKPTAPMRHGLLVDRTLHPHNELLLVAAEVGIVGALVFLIALVCIVRRLLREADGEGRLIAWLIVAGLGGMFAQGLVSVALRFWAPAAMFWTLVGLALALPRCRDADEPSGRANPNVRFAATATAIVLALVGFRAVVWSGHSAEWLMNRGVSRVPVRGRLPREVLAERAECYGRAMARSRYVPDYLYAAYHRAERLHGAGKLDDAIAAYEVLVEQAPAYMTRVGSANLRLALFYKDRIVQRGTREPERLADDFRRAIASVSTALEVYPYDYPTRFLKTELLLMASPDNEEAALEVAQEGVAIAPEKPDGYYMKARLLELLARPEDALEELRKGAALCGEGDETTADRIAHMMERLKKPG